MLFIEAKQTRRPKKNRGGVHRGEENGDSHGRLYMAVIKDSKHSTVDLSRCSMGDTGARDVVTYYTSQQPPFTLSPSYSCNITTLILQWNDIWADGARTIAILLSHENTTINKLDLGHNSIGSTGVCHIATALRYNKTLRLLELNDNGIEDEGAADMLSCFDENQTLFRVGLSCNPCNPAIIARISERAQANHDRRSMDGSAQNDPRLQAEMAKVTSLASELNIQKAQYQILLKKCHGLEKQNAKTQQNISKSQKQLKENNIKEKENTQQLENEIRQLRDEIDNYYTIHNNSNVSILQKQLDILIDQKKLLETEETKWQSERSSLLRKNHELEYSLQRFDVTRLQALDTDALAMLEEELESVLKTARSIRVAKLKKKNEDLAETRKCKVCFENPIDTLLVPCAHLVMCQTCSNKVVKCPLCSILIDKRMKVFEG